ncbi:MAG: threonine-phosphate decarboxylase [Candidatus Omnitrophota bacterium]
MAQFNFVHGGRLYESEERTGRKMVDFSASINPLGLPYRVREDLFQDWKRILHYPDPEGIGLMKKISQYWEIPPENIILGNGSNELIYLVISTFRPGSVLIPVPTFSEYERAVRANDGRPVFFKLSEKEGFTLNLEKACDYGTDAIFICNPNNPTGNLLLTDQQEFTPLINSRCRGLIHQARPVKGDSLLYGARGSDKSDPYLGGFNLSQRLVVIDEAFMDFLPDQEKYTFLRKAIDRKNLIVLRSFTKFFALAGLRLGYLVAHRDRVGDLRKKLSPWNVNALALRAGELMLTQKGYAHETYRLIAGEREFLSREISRIKGLRPFPSAANFILVKIALPGITSTRLTAGLGKAGLLVRDCANFRNSGNKFIRIAVRTRRENELLVTTLNKIMGKYI